MDLVLSGICLKDWNGRFTRIFGVFLATRLSQCWVFRISGWRVRAYFDVILEEAPNEDLSVSLTCMRTPAGASSRS
jgi:hypothetical protein